MLAAGPCWAPQSCAKCQITSSPLIPSDPIMARFQPLFSRMIRGLCYHVSPVFLCLNANIWKCPFKAFWYPGVPRSTHGNCVRWVQPVEVLSQVLLKFLDRPIRPLRRHFLLQSSLLLTRQTPLEASHESEGSPRIGCNYVSLNYPGLNFTAERSVQGNPPETWTSDTWRNEELH